MNVLAPVLGLVLIAAAVPLRAALPGFRIEKIATLPGFATSIVFDSRGTLYFTSQEGWIYRLNGSMPERIVALPTRANANAGLLGMAMLNDQTAVVHYTTSDGPVVIDDVISLVRFPCGTEAVLYRFVGDIEKPSRGVSEEHHGGNPAVGPDGSIYVGIGEYNGFIASQRDEWNGGKIWRVTTDGQAEQYAKGMRNPFDLTCDPDLNALVVLDNGPEDGGDELNIVPEGANCGWPLTYGNRAAVEGMVVPSYVYPMTVAPVGVARLRRNANPILRRGYLVATFVTAGLHYFPDITADPIPEPIPLFEHFEEFVIDVAQAPDGSIWFVTGWFPATMGIYRLEVPERGDCNGDGATDWLDLFALQDELRDGDPQPMVAAQDGSHAGSWGCDANADDLISSADLDSLARRLMRRRAARH